MKVIIYYVTVVAIAVTIVLAGGIIGPGTPAR